MFYLGFSVGPAIGAYLIRHPFLSGHSGSSVHNGSPTVTSVFYVATVCSFVNLLLVIFVFPESLNKKAKNSEASRVIPTWLSKAHGVFVVQLQEAAIRHEARHADPVRRWLHCLGSHFC